MNLLLGSEFERKWSPEIGQNIHVFLSNNTREIRKIDNIFPPYGWEFFFYHEPGKWDQPEARIISEEIDPARVLQGRQAYMWFNNRRYMAGIYQVVPTVSGNVYILGANAHAWSAHPIPGYEEHANDPRWSAGAGTDPFYCLTEDLPPLNGDPWNDAAHNFEFKIGIDPTGGTNPFADSVVWSPGAAIYNMYHKLPILEVEAASDNMCAFLMSKTKWEFKHADTYWDSISLVEVGEEPEECLPGSDAREPFDRLVVLPSPPHQTSAVVEVGAYPIDRYAWSIERSADDAGLGRGLKSKTVVVLNPDGFSDNIFAFFERYYPDVDNIHGVHFDTDVQLSGRLLAIGLRREGITLKYPTTNLPMFVTSQFGVFRGTYYHNGLDLRSSWDVWRDKILCAYPGKVIVSGELDAENWFGIQVRTKSLLSDGREMLIRYAHLHTASPLPEIGESLSAGAFVGWPDNTGNSTGDHLHIDVKIVDKAYGTEMYADPEILIDIPSKPPSPEPQYAKVVEPITFHRQTGIHDELVIIKELKPEWVLLVAVEAELARSIKEVSPNTKVAFRHVIDHQQPFLDHPDPYVASNQFLNMFWEAVTRNPIDAIQLLNETIATDDLVGIEKAVRFEAAGAHVVADKSHGDLAAIVLNPGIANPRQGKQEEMLIPAIQAAVDTNGYVGAHTYIPCNTDWTKTLEWFTAESIFYHMRPLLSWDPVFRAHNLYPRYIFTEFSPFFAPPRDSDGRPWGMPLTNAGWKHELTLPSDNRLDKCLFLLRTYKEFILSWNRLHGNRCRAACFFTTNLRADDWPDCHFNEHEWKQYLAQR